VSALPVANLTSKIASCQIHKTIETVRQRDSSDSANPLWIKTCTLPTPVRAFGVRSNLGDDSTLSRIVLHFALPPLDHSPRLPSSVTCPHVPPRARHEPRWLPGLPSRPTEGSPSSRSPVKSVRYPWPCRKQTAIGANRALGLPWPTKGALGPAGLPFAHRKEGYAKRPFHSRI
jgi:hypothetical protein